MRGLSRQVRWGVGGALVACALGVGGVGCQDSEGGGQGAAVGNALAKAEARPYSLLKRTAQPFNFYLVSGGNITLYDVDDEKELLTTDLPVNSLFRFDPKTGVKVGENTLLEGPLPEKNTRELRLNR